MGNRSKPHSLIDLYFKHAYSPVVSTTSDVRLHSAVDGRLGPLLDGFGKRSYDLPGDEQSQIHMPLDLRAHNARVQGVHCHSTVCVRSPGQQS